MPQMRVAPFLTAFRAKREYRALAETFPIRLVTEERLGLLGALGSCLE
jgi:glucokinase